MRYTCRLAGKPAEYDRQFPGTYNARRDSLDDYWGKVSGRNHAVMVISGFYENVPLHLYEHRELVPDEKEKNLVLEFDPQRSQDMLVACVWDRWSRQGSSDLYSFAAITDEPTPEVTATGHLRTVITLQQSHLPNGFLPQQSVESGWPTSFQKNKLPTTCIRLRREDWIVSQREAPFYGEYCSLANKA